MSKTIAVTGATGAQGGGVVNVMKKTPGWKVRALTRNVESDAAEKLAAERVEVVSASFDDESSLAAAFEASAKKTAEKLLKGELTVPHMDYKAKVDERIKSELSNLAKKTTYLLFGYYPQNLLLFPMLTPFEYSGTGYHIQVLPTDPDAKILLSGDMNVNPGIWVRQCLASAPKAFGRYANVALEKWTFKQMVDVWSEVTGKKGHFGERCDPWAETKEHISPEELGIDTSEVIGFQGTIEGIKHLF
ncbi:DNA mismatch repair protein msh6 [Pestalotiopsis sp. IQ-011]